MTGAFKLKVDENSFLLDFEKKILIFYTLHHKKDFGKHSWYHYGQYSVLTLLHSERPKLQRVLAFLSAIGLIYKMFDLICMDLICC